MTIFFIYCFFLIGLIVSGLSSRIFTVIVIVLTYTINSLSIPVLDGGNNLIFLMLIYLLIPNEGKIERFEDELSDAFFTLSYFQISIMYFVSSVYKIQTNAWTSGEALFDILMSIEYSTPIVSKIVWHLPPDIFVFSNYLVILFQLTFFIGVITSRTKYMYLLFGVAMHLSIGLVVGLPTFALSVLVCYIQFLPAEAFSDKIKQGVQDWLLISRISHEGATPNEAL